MHETDPTAVLGKCREARWAQAHGEGKCLMQPWWCWVDSVQATASCQDSCMLSADKTGGVPARAAGALVQDPEEREHDFFVEVPSSNVKHVPGYAKAMCK